MKSVQNVAWKDADLNSMIGLQCISRYGIPFAVHGSDFHLRVPSIISPLFCSLAPPSSLLVVELLSVLSSASC
jgi:hypothetical protein